MGRVAQVSHVGHTVHSLVDRLVHAVLPSRYVWAYDALSTSNPRHALVIRDTPLERLSDATYLEGTLLPRLGVAGTIPAIFPSELQGVVGTGLQSMQWPIQLAPYLVALSGFPIRSYLEIGVFLGGTFATTVEYLDRFRRLDRAIAVDRNFGVVARRYKRVRPNTEFVRTTSGTSEFRRRVQAWNPDLVLIDADHTYQAVSNDFACVDGIARMIALHDIVDNASPGVRRLWTELRAERSDDYRFFEFVAQYPEVQSRFGGALLGLGLAVRRDFAARGDLVIAQRS
jgi:hypothetical protein